MWSEADRRDVRKFFYIVTRFFHRYFCIVFLYIRQNILRPFSKSKLELTRTRVMQKNFLSMWIIFFALKERLQALEFEICQIKLG